MKQNQLLTNLWVVAGLALFSCALWGSAFAAVKTGYAVLGLAADDWASQLWFGGIRFAVAGLMVLLFGSLTARKPLLPQRRTIPKIGIISLFQTILQYFCYYIGLAHTSGVRAAVLVGTNVFTAILIAAGIHMEKLTARKLTGSLIGFAGLVAINFSGLRGGSGFRFLGDGMILLCTVASGCSSVCMKKYAADENPVLLSGWQFLFGGIVLALIGFAGGGRLHHVTPEAVLLMLYLAFVSAAAYSVWALLLKANPVSRVAVFGFTNPVFGVLISAIVLHERSKINGSFVLALLLVCIGIVTVNLSPHQLPQAVREDETQ
ncbi:MAG: DMT family transporter [Oscillospiraceae bacterium]|nr:DMT family transporter [Oscillospiraceae bacterium]